MIPMERKVKIIATIGPASDHEDTLVRLMQAGMNVARLNFSHDSHASHSSRINLLRSVAKKLGRPVAILQDLQGPKIRVGTLVAPLVLAKGQTITLCLEGSSVTYDPYSIPVDFPQLFDVIKKGDRILLDDGRLELRVQKNNPDGVMTKVIMGGGLTSHKGINLPGIQIDIPAVTDKDIEDLKFGLSLGIDAVALSFVQKAEDVTKVNEIINSTREKLPLVIAKLERPQALENLEEILQVVDGVMVARGDLGVEMPPEKVPGAQKNIIYTANRRGRIVATATQMLETMIHAPLPTRAEASDIANAVYDGTDAVMLSAETAVGDYPVESVSMMDRIIRQAEGNYDQWGHGQALIADQHDDAGAIVRAARELAHDRDVEAIAVFTRTGRTAILMSKARPCVPVLAFTPVEETYQRLAIAWGVIPSLVPWADTVEEMIAHVESAIRRTGVVRPGGQVVLVSGYPVRDFRLPNMALLHTVG